MLSMSGVFCSVISHCIMQRSMLIPQLRLLQCCIQHLCNMVSKAIEQSKVDAFLEEKPLQKRLQIVNVTKSRDDYGHLLQARACTEYVMPDFAMTPPSTPTVDSKEPKREWERRMITWKHSLKVWAQWWIQHRVASPGGCSLKNDCA